MDSPSDGANVPSKVSSGPLRVHRDGDEVVVTGFGLWIPVKNEEEGRLVIEELEQQGFKICY
jgi:hypothetical protein